MTPRMNNLFWLTFYRSWEVNTTFILRSYSVITLAGEVHPSFFTSILKHKAVYLFLSALVIWISFKILRCFIKIAVFLFSHLKKNFCLMRGLALHWKSTIWKSGQYGIFFTSIWFYDLNSNILPLTNNWHFVTHELLKKLLLGICPQKLI